MRFQMNSFILLCLSLLLGSAISWDPAVVDKIKNMAKEWEAAGDIKTDATAPTNHVPTAQMGGLNDGILPLMVSGFYSRESPVLIYQICGRLFAYYC
jgi:hypothetical protein